MTENLKAEIVWDLTHIGRKETAAVREAEKAAFYRDSMLLFPGINAE